MQNDTIQILPIDKIQVLNPRTRNQKVFADLVENIATIGLKRPITVTPSGDNAEYYDLLCGQGRLEACQVLGELFIPCRVVSANSEESYLISLVENIARRKHSYMELLSGIKILNDRGYKPVDIARKIGFSKSHVNSILHLINAGEERLINAVEQGVLPITIAISISRSDDQEVQRQLTELYTNGTLKSTDIAKIRNLIHRRNLAGKKANTGISGGIRSSIYNPKTVVNIYKEETERQKVMIKQADYDEKQLSIILSCLNKLFADKYFQLVLKSEHLDDMPKDLSQRMLKQREGNIYA
ncbi:plasmid partitioning protein RepB C-terminal domain-containing protein [Pasteurella multocida]|uniref:plasmid partitioning protein RepB C-terminal domain-containing protein n=1 Tax=Pasteurella multocida TaxID=747 RepID=UPI00111A301D|nr:plasmid partitioning protein RepB C-terminal domain-containing protein [Pasteurella multocida]MDY0488944.1 ParB N-terminal domain-containing protein [Pasteurella multocida]MDY0595506.1 ParB N-terminal domain-containing protein [Pasteurella multocida]MDY0632877.1 ParB N-terminal domain-containing protein [Pasteurella multocida]MDY0664878.1 ParB N-terminal domain-containing protein [Pasteurella multocida]MDY0666972.1 ParB N-terminal domain-containing protein [Pasteurella multocida]